MGRRRVYIGIKKLVKVLQENREFREEVEELFEKVREKEVTIRIRADRMRKYINGKKIHKLLAYDDVRIVVNIRGVYVIAGIDRVGRRYVEELKSIRISNRRSGFEDYLMLKARLQLLVAAYALEKRYAVLAIAVIEEGRKYHRITIKKEYYRLKPGFSEVLEKLVEVARTRTYPFY